MTPVASLLRVVFTGPESTGKTWLAGRLSRAFRVPCSPEAAREIAAAKGGPLEPADIDRVARRQIELEEAAITAARRDGRGLVLHDTDLVSTVVYGRHYNGSCPAWIEREAARRAAPTSTSSCSPTSRSSRSQVSAAAKGIVQRSSHCFARP